MSNSRSDCMLLEVGLDIPSTVRGSALASAYVAGHAGGSMTGRRRAVNDDAWVALPDLGVFLVADGCGGRASGRTAANLALSTIERVLSAGAPGVVEPLAAALDEANARICGAQVGEQRGMSASVVALRLAPPWIVTASVGQCRIHRYRRGIDPSSMRGVDARRSVRESHGAVTTQALGTAPDELEIQVHYASYRSGDLFLLCSDGVTNQLDEESIRALLSGDEASLDARCKRLLQAADERGGKDDATAVLVQM
jgi:serine/threonine protein phosphatase PrpC